MNEDNIKCISDGVEDDSQIVDKYVDNLVGKCCDKLDTYVEYVSNLLNDNKYPITVAELDDIVMTIPTLLYFVGDVQERLGIRSDVAESTKKILYNQILADSEGTVQKKQSIAELAVHENTIVNIIYSRAYNRIKSKVTFALELLQSVKKVVSRRMVEAELSNSTPNRIVIPKE